jgi:hypothetical protein
MVAWVVKLLFLAIGPIRTGIDGFFIENLRSLYNQFRITDARLNILIVELSRSVCRMHSLIIGTLRASIDKLPIVQEFFVSSSTLLEL